MPGNPTNAALWAEADVYVAALDATLPASIADPFPSEWGLVGLLSGEDGFKTVRAEEAADLFAWGGILVRTSRKNFKLTMAFTALEDNEVTRSLVWPGSSPGQIVVPKPTDLLLAFETREGERIRRLISAGRAQVDVAGEITENETDLTKFALIGTIFPTNDGVLFIEQTTGDANANAGATDD